MSRLPVLAAAALTLGAVAAVGVALVAATHGLTAARIAANEREALVRRLAAILPPGIRTDALLRDAFEARDPALLGSARTLVYRARRKGEPVALVIAPIAPDGYGGPIKLLVAVLKDGTLGGVRVVADSETPGLGDKIQATKSDWILGFAGKSLVNPPLAKWKVKRDGGEFDQFTGATITPRAVVKAVRNTLIYVRQHRQTLYSQPSAQRAAEKKGAP
jgi:electron transport complex protein RnfG